MLSPAVGCSFIFTAQMWEMSSHFHRCNASLALFTTDLSVFCYKMMSADRLCLETRCAQRSRWPVKRPFSVNLHISGVRHEVILPKPPDICRAGFLSSGLKMGGGFNLRNVSHAVGLKSDVTDLKEVRAHAHLDVLVCTVLAAIPAQSAQRK